MLITAIVVFLLLVAALLWWTRRNGNSGARSVDEHGVHEGGAGGAKRPDVPPSGGVQSR